MSNFSELDTTQKGDVGEDIVDRWLCERGYLPYAPIQAGSHQFDRFAIHKKTKKIICYDVKAKAKRRYYDDTGLDLNDWHKYVHFNDQIEFIIFWVDEEMGMVYGNSVRKCSKPHTERGITYPHIDGNIIYLPLHNLKKCTKLTDEDKKNLKKCTTKQQKYVTRG